METVLRIPKNPDGTAKTIPPISPSLMPFHIAYSGPAPISTYFMPRKFVDEREELRRGLIENSASVGSGSTSKQDAAGAAPLGDTRDEVESKYFQESGKEGELVGPVVPTPPAPATGVENGKQKEEEERLSASFRGRRIVSQNVRIPEGFVGVLLTHDGTTTASTSSSSNVRAPIVGDTENGARQESPRKAKAAAAAKAKERAKALKAKAAAKLKAKGKATRKSKRNATEDDEDEIDELEEDDEDEEDENDGEEEGERVGDLGGNNTRGTKDEESGIASGETAVQRAFEVKGAFETFKLWHQDVPVNEGQDEYIRSLNEWISLNAEIHKI